MKLYSYWRSSCAWRVRIALNLKGYQYEYVAVNLVPGVSEQEGQKYSAVNPFQQVPTLEWRGEGSKIERLTQSAAIIEYLDEIRPEPALLPHDPILRARVREAVQIVNSGIQPLQNTWLQNQMRQIGGEEIVPTFMQTVIRRGLSVLEAHAQLHAGRYLIGDKVSMADLYLVPQLYNARRAHVDLSAFPKLTAIEHTLEQLPAFAGARPERQPDAAQA